MCYSHLNLRRFLIQITTWWHMVPRVDITVPLDGTNKQIHQEEITDFWADLGGPI